MKQTARLFMNGRSQAVRLPVEYRFDCDEVFIRKDPQTGDVILSRKPGTWEDFFRLTEALAASKEADDFMLERDTGDPQTRDLF